MKTEDNLIPEEEFLRRNKVYFRAVKCPVCVMSLVVTEKYTYFFPLISQCLLKCVDLAVLLGLHSAALS